MTYKSSDLRKIKQQRSEIVFPKFHYSRGTVIRLNVR